MDTHKIMIHTTTQVHTNASTPERQEIEQHHCGEVGGGPVGSGRPLARKHQPIIAPHLREDGGEGRLGEHAMTTHPLRHSLQ